MSNKYSIRMAVGVPLLLLLPILSGRQIREDLSQLREQAWSVVSEETGSQNPERRAAAITQLGEIPRKRSVGLLDQALRDVLSPIRNVALHGLFNLYTKDDLLSDAEMVGYLKEAAKDQDPLIRAKACQFMARIVSAPTIPIIEELLHDSEWTVRNVAAQALGAQGDLAIPILPMALKHEDVAVRALAAQAIGKTGKKTLAPALRDALSDSSVDVRRFAAEGLVRLEGKIYLPVLEEIWRQSSEQARILSAATVYNLGHDSYLGVIANAIEEKDARLRAIAVQSLLKVDRNRTQILPLLTKALSDKDDSVRLTALTTIDELGGTGIDLRELQALTRDSNEYIRLKALKILAESGFPLESSSLEQFLASKHLKKEAIRLLTSARDKNVSQLLARALQDENPGVREAAFAVAAARNGDGIAPGQLIEAFKDPDLRVRTQAIKTVTEMPTTVIADMLRRALTSDEEKLRTSAAIAVLLIQEK